MLKQPRSSEYSADAESMRTAFRSHGKGRTRQEFKDDADINLLLKRFGVTGKMPAPLKAPQYGDFTQVDDFESAMNALLDARDRFDALPASIRDEFDNDPQEFLDFVQDPENEDEAREMGLIPKKEGDKTPPTGATKAQEGASAPPDGQKQDPEGSSKGARPKSPEK